METEGMNTEELRKYANLRGFNIGQAEKDYYQNIILFILYGRLSRELVFKGGTALAKCYGLNRFSEDLDFTVTEPKDFIDYIRQGLAEFGIKNTIKDFSGEQNSKKYKIKIEGPLYQGNERTLCSITLDFSLRERVLRNGVIATIGQHMDIIPVFDVYAMGKEEILAEKIRAIMTRRSARDLYDLVFLIKLGVNADFDLIEQKLKFYSLSFDKEKFMGKCLLIEKIWNSELKSLVKNVPVFENYMEEVKKLFLKN